MATEVVTDTNVVVYLLLRTAPFITEVQPFWQSSVRALAPAHWQAEVANAVWGACRAQSMDAATARVVLNRAAMLGIESVAVSNLWQGALARSIATRLAIYDTLFVELAIRRNCRLATFDQAVLRAYPDIAARPGELL